MKTIPVYNRSDLVVLIDDEDFERVSQYSWSVQSKNFDDKLIVYTTLHFNRKSKYLPLGSFILSTESMVDHIDRDPLNNQKSNLRIATYAQNNHNKTKRINPTSQYFGVTKLRGKNKRWLFQIRKDGVKYNKCFLTEIEAAKAYDEKAKELYGEFANLNFPNT